MKGWCAKIVEAKTKLELANKNSPKEGFIVDGNNETEDEEIPFV
jgi:hypothetical protein